MQERVRDSILSYLKSKSPGRILDIPAGRAWLREALGAEWQYRGADLYTEPGVDGFEQADLNRTLPWDDASFDAVACLEGLEHIENYHAVLRELGRVLVPGGHLIVSTPNPLNVKSRKRFFWRGTFNGFPHLIDMPRDGDHLHMSPINLSFLLSFAGKYGLELDGIQRVAIPGKAMRHALHAFAIQAYTFLKYRFRSDAEWRWMRRLTTLDILLGDGIVVAFRKSADS